MSAILPGPRRVVGGMSSRRWASVRLIGMLLALAALLVLVQSDHPQADVAHAQTDNTPPVRGFTYLTDVELSIGYDEALDPNSNPATDAFTVTVDGVERTIDDAYISGTETYLILETPGYQGQTVTVSYEEPSTNPIQDTSGNKAPEFANVGVTNQSGPRPTDMTPPERVGTPTVDEAATGESVLTIVYNEDLDAANPGTNAFTVTVDGEEVEIDEVELGRDFVNLFLGVNVYRGQTVTVSYTTPGPVPTVEAPDERERPAVEVVAAPAVPRSGARGGRRGGRPRESPVMYAPDTGACPGRPFRTHGSSQTLDGHRRPTRW